MGGAIMGPVSYGLIPKEDWLQPEWIDEERAAASRAQMVADNVVYGGTLSLDSCLCPGAHWDMPTADSVS